MKRNRRIVQGAVLAFVLLGVFVWGGHCERWCPFGGVEALYTYAAEGNMLCSLGTSNFFILGGVVLATVLLRRAFCGYLCPIGTISEWTNALARRLHLASVRVPARMDRVLGLLKYGVLALILVWTYRAGELIFRAFDPCYALISRHGEDITVWAYVVAGAILVASLFLALPFCRWLCPLAAVLNGFSRFGLASIHRDPARCRDCGVCAKRCPMAIPVDQVDQVTASRCLSCLNCVEACRPSKGQPPALRWGLLGQGWSQAALLLILIGCTSAAVAASYLFPLPSFVHRRGTAPAETGFLQWEVENLTCRGRGNLLVYFLERDDRFAIPGYYRLEAWPGPGLAHIRLYYDPALTDELAIQRAVTEPYYEAASNFWRQSPFHLVGYDPLGLDDDLDLEALLKGFPE
jgi:Pyruvate/2-oxoacid:ferredoxin oxidoreductase delta subunit